MDERENYSELDTHPPWYKSPGTPTMLFCLAGFAVIGALVIVKNWKWFLPSQ